MNTQLQPNVVKTFPYEFSTEDHVWIPMPDGVRLSVKLWKPVARTPGEKFPVVLEAIPYRKDDVCLLDDTVRFDYFAGHGYICARLDLRGSGDSEGVLEDEYCVREQLDICSAIAWLADLPESNGNVGMTGISWSGFNCLQVAQHRPAALKGIITVCSTDDRYDNDVHYMGGSLLAFYQNWWGSIMHAFNIRPADPLRVGDKWRPMQIDRMNFNPQLTSIWTAHQTRDYYWFPGSVCQNYSAIECPVLAVGGWHDGYTDAIMRLVDNDTAPTWGLIGPWGHTWPERGIPGPVIGFLQECLRFWDHFLKGEETGIEKEPKIRYYQMDACKLTPDLDYRPGHWMGTESLGKGRRIARLVFDTSKGLVCPDAKGCGAASTDAAGAQERGVVGAAPSAAGVAAGAAAAVAAGAGATANPGIDERLGIDASLFDTLDPAQYCVHASSLLTGTQVDTWLPMGSPIDLPSEQTPDDVRSLCFDSGTLTCDFVIAGQPVVHLRVAASEPWAFVFARLSDVWPDGTSHQITRGNMNLTHYLSHQFPEDLVPGQFYEVDIPLKVVAQTVPAGHKIRLAISTSYWPWIWPSRQPAAIAVDAAGSSLLLPGPADSDIALGEPFEPGQIARGVSCECVKKGSPFTVRTYDPETGIMEFSRSTDDDSLQRNPSGMIFGDKKHTRYCINENDPLSATMESVRCTTFKRDDWMVVSEVNSCMSCTYDDFVITTDTKVYEGEKLIHCESHTETIPRVFN